jgi:hypothetical protein
MDRTRRDLPESDRDELYPGMARQASVAIRRVVRREEQIGGPADGPDEDVLLRRLKMTTRQNNFERFDLHRMIEQVSEWLNAWFSDQNRALRRVMIGAILTLALIAFELFNFSTTEYALENLLGTISFAGLRWATILAFAFCGIDFAGLARLIARDDDQPRTTILGRPNWLILGAWLLGGGMNAIMTWWAVSLALMNHSLGNELLSRAQLLHVVPVFVAILVWMTRILIISSFVTAADRAISSASSVSGRGQKQTAAVDRPSLPIGAPRREPVPVRVRSSAEEASKEEAEAPERSPLPGSRPNGRPANGPVLPRAPRGTRPNTVPLQMRRNTGGRRHNLS